jgi:predicted transcriptional regulator
MNQYFNEILQSLSIDDVEIMKLLNEQKASTKFRSIKKKYVFELSGLSEAMFRKVVYRLEAIRFIEIVYGGKEHKLVLTPFGEKALEQLRLENSTILKY